MKRRTTETARPVRCFFPLLVGSPLQPPLPPLPPNTSLLIYGTRGSASESARPHLPGGLVEATSYGDAPPAAIAPASGGYRTAATDLEWAAAAEWAVSFAPQMFAPRVAEAQTSEVFLWHLHMAPPAIGAINRPRCRFRCARGRAALESTFPHNADAAPEYASPTAVARRPRPVPRGATRCGVRPRTGAPFFRAAQAHCCKAAPPRRMPSPQPAFPHASPSKPI